MRCSPGESVLLSVFIRGKVEAGFDCSGNARSATMIIVSCSARKSIGLSL